MSEIKFALFHHHELHLATTAWNSWNMEYNRKLWHAFILNREMMNWNVFNETLVTRTHCNLFHSEHLQLYYMHLIVPLASSTHKAVLKHSPCFARLMHHWNRKIIFNLFLCHFFIYILLHSYENKKVLISFKIFKTYSGCFQCECKVDIF